MKILKLLIVISIFLFTGCSKTKINNDLYATWVFSKHENQIHEYVKGSNFIEDRPGIKFKRNGEIIKRQNVGWCGTPPVTYDNYPGSWTSISDNSINITYEYWGGTGNQNWKIIDLTNQTLKIKIEY
jgi:hypothetical protein